MSTRRFRYDPTLEEVVEITDGYSDPRNVSIGPYCPNTYTEADPLVSLGAGCHPSQVAEFNERTKADGFTGVNYRADGTCEFTSRGQRAAFLRHRGLHDNDGGYGDG